MAFWDDVNKTVKKTTGYDPSTGQGNALTGTFGGEGEFSGSKDAAAGPQNPVFDPQQQPQMDAAKQQYDLRQKMEGLANDFQSPDGVQKDIYHKFRNERLGNLVTDQQSSERRLAKRGLGYGGIAQGANARLQGDASFDLETGKSKIKSAAEEQASQIRADALGSAIKQRQDKQAVFDVVYSQAIDEYRHRRDAMKAVGQGAGMVIGTAYSGPVGGAAGGEAGGEVLG